MSNSLVNFIEDQMKRDAVTVAISTYPEYYGADCTEEEAEEIADFIANIVYSAYDVNTVIGKEVKSKYDDEIAGSKELLEEVENFIDSNLHRLLETYNIAKNIKARR